jgi:DNA-binding response OmpR family regulator
MTGKAGPLSQERVLIVEDRYLLASELAREVERLGGQVVGPARTLGQAAELVGREPVQAVLLDINLDGELAFPLAEALADREVPFLFLTGYDADILPDVWRAWPRLAKPVDPRQLEAALVGLVEAKS